MKTICLPHDQKNILDEMFFEHGAFIEEQGNYALIGKEQIASFLQFQEDLETAQILEQAFKESRDPKTVKLSNDEVLKNLRQKISLR